MSDLAPSRLALGPLLRGGPNGGGTAGLGPGVLLLIVLVGADAAVGSRAALAGSFLAAPFVPAFSGSRRATAGLALAAVAAAALSGAWNGNTGDPDYWLRIALVAMGGVLACGASLVVASREGARRRLEILDRVAQIASGRPAPREILDGITNLLVPELGALCAIDLLSPEREPSRAAFRASGPRAASIERALGKRRPSLPQEMIDPEGTPKPRIFAPMSEADLRALAHDQEDLSLLSEVGINSAMTIPLMARGRCTGAISLISIDAGAPYTDDDVRFAALLAGRVALALDSAGLFSDLEQVERRMETAMAVLGEAVVIHTAGGAAIYANPAAYRMLRVPLADGLESFSLAELRDRFNLFDEEGEVVGPERFAAIEALAGEHPDNQVLRAVASSEGFELWVRATSSVIPAAAGQPRFVVTAMEDVTDLKRSELDQKLLATLGEPTSSSLDYEASVRRLAATVVPSLADWCSVFVPRGNGLIEEVATAHRDERKVSLVRQIVGEFPREAAEAFGFSGDGALTDKTASLMPGPLFERIAADEHHLGLLQDLGLGSVMLVPMRAGESLVGALVMGNEIGRTPFNAADERLADAVAQRAITSLENARLATETAEIADTLQKGLLAAPLPDIPGWDVAALYRPAGAENEVGGDFYDAFRYEGGWMIVVGDVTGHGAQAASVTGLVRHTVRAAAAITGDPLASLATVNRTLLARRDRALCGLAAIALGASGSSTVRIAVAGHPPPLLVSGAEVCEAAETGPILGAFAEAEWTLKSVDIAGSEQLVVFTDGVPDAGDSEGRLGEERLRDRLRGVAGPGGAVRAVNEALDAFGAGGLKDDAAMVALARHGRGAAPVREFAEAPS